MEKLKKGFFLITILIILVCVIQLGYINIRYSGSTFIAGLNEKDDYVVRDVPLQQILVNKLNVLPPDYKMTYTLVQGIKVAKIMEPDLNKMLEKALQDGISLTITSGFLTYEEQEKKFMSYVNHYVNLGFSSSEAFQKANMEEFPPNYSEHQTGLAIDFDIANKDALEWITQHAKEYGFILRYPKGAESVTGMRYHPEHYRYLGKDISQEITERNITYEEYYQEFVKIS